MDQKTLGILEFNKIIEKLAGFAASSLGKELAEALVPETEFSKVKACLKETSDAVSFIVRRGSPPMGGLHDIKGSIRRVDFGGVLNPGELLKIADVLYACRNLKNYASGGNIPVDGDNVAWQLIQELETNRRIEDKIKNAVISEDEISDGASATLADIRRKIREHQNSIKDKLNEIIKSSRYQKYMQEAIVTVRGDRYVVPVKQEFRNEVPGIVHDISSSGATIFIEPMPIVEANNNIRQLKLKEQQEIERILYELTTDVSEIAAGLTADMKLMAQLDFMFAKAKLSVEYNCVCPMLNTERRLIIKKGRHPLLERKTVVPIDFWIGEEFDTLVVTGPNTGGKTVTLKTVGLFCLMTQAGLHIPANEGTEMAVFDKVFADIGDEQSIEQSLSTFSSHMKNIIRILNEADSGSLALFDELGAGTDPTEGAALAMSILEDLRSRGTVTIATTHYSELKVYAVSTPGVENACCEFDVETLRPTYNLLIGIPGKSNAFAISGRLGLSDPIIGRAKEFLTQEDLKFEDMLLTIEKNRKESEKERMTAQNYRLQIENLKKELEGQNYKLASQKEQLLKEAKEKARRILLDARDEADQILAEMKRIEKEQEAQERDRAAEELRIKLRNKLNIMEDSLAESLMPRNTYVKPPKNLKPGDTVMVVNLGKKGEIVIPPNKDGDTLVQLGIMKVNVHVTNLRLVETDKTTEMQKGFTGKTSVMKSRDISIELDLRGMSVDEAIQSVDKYLDDASMAGLGEVTIIHGKGTGVLRNGIHHFLRTNAHVSAFRLGKIGEGDSGVTIVELK